MPVQRYSAAAAALHWAIAILLAFQLSLGWGLEDLPRSQGAFVAFQLHKSVGMLILALTLGRIAVRVMCRRPRPLGDSMAARRLAAAVHAALYGFMLGAPLTGWALVSTARIRVPTVLFGAIPLPHLPLPASANGPAGAAHGFLALVGVLLFVLHVAGAVRHQFAKHENVLGRMIPGTGGKPMAAGASAGLATLALALMGGAFLTARTMTLDTRATSPAPTPSAPLPANPQAEAAPLPDPPTAATPTLTAAAEEAEAPVPSQWMIAPASRLGFTASWNGTPVEGRFAKWSGTITFDPEALAASSISITVDLASASTDDEQRDSMLQGSDFFDVASGPRATYASRTIRSLGGNRYAADGTLTLHGRTRPVALRFTVNIAGETARASGSATLDRTRFGVGSGEWAATDQIAANVAVSFAITARRKP